MMKYEADLLLSHNICMCVHRLRATVAASAQRCVHTSGFTHSCSVVHSVADEGNV